MGRAPAEVVMAIKAKVSAVKQQRTKPAPAEAVSEPPASLEVFEAPIPGAEAHAAEPHGAWCCHVCGNVATGPVCTVDGAKGT